MSLRDRIVYLVKPEGRRERGCCDFSLSLSCLVIKDGSVYTWRGHEGRHSAMNITTSKNARRICAAMYTCTRFYLVSLTSGEKSRGLNLHVEFTDKNYLEDEDEKNKKVSSKNSRNNNNNKNYKKIHRVCLRLNFCDPRPLDISHTVSIFCLCLHIHFVHRMLVPRHFSHASIIFIRCFIDISAVSYNKKHS